MIGPLRVKFPPEGKPISLNWARTVHRAAQALRDRVAAAPDEFPECPGGASPPQDSAQGFTGCFENHLYQLFDGNQEFLAERDQTGNRLDDELLRSIRARTRSIAHAYK